MKRMNNRSQIRNNQERGKHMAYVRDWGFMDRLAEVLEGSNDPGLNAVASNYRCWKARERKHHPATSAAFDGTVDSHASLSQAQSLRLCRQPGLEIVDRDS